MLDAEADLRVVDGTGVDTEFATNADTDTQQLSAKRPGITEILGLSAVRRALLTFGFLAFIAISHDAIWPLW